MHTPKPKLAIIGAGIAGLNLARLLTDVADVTVFEKSDKLGGRVATHHAEGFDFDHGAQFFTAKTAAFKALVKELEAQGVVKQWHARFVELDPTGVKSERVWDEDFPHYVGSPSMNSMAKFLANNTQVHFNQLITGMQKKQSAWFLQTQSDEHGPFDWVIVTTPAEQAQTILPATFTPNMPYQGLKMQPCFALMLGYDAPIAMDWDAAFVSNSILSWVSVNSSKPDRAAHFSLLALSSNAWADEHFALDDKVIIAKMLAELERISGKQFSGAAYLKLKKWKYANAYKQAQALELIDYAHQLACCGDWCVSGRIESAFLSSSRVAQKLKDACNKC